MPSEQRERLEEIGVRNPYTGEEVGCVARMGTADIRRAIEAARERPRLTPDRRSQILAAAAGELALRKEEFARRITDEAGTCIRESLKEVERARGNLLVAAEEAIRIHGEALQIPGTEPRRMALTIREPIGVVAAITPFNRPLNQVVVKVAPAIAAGNGVVLKPSERAPLSALAFASVMTKCGLPPGTLNVVTGDPVELGSALAGGAVDMVTFTGSVATGRAIAELAGAKKLALELGGNDPLIVLNDGDPARAARIAADQAFAAAGQSCRGVKRVIVVGDVADELVGRLAAEAQRRRWGDPYEPDTEVGPLIDEAAAAEVQRRCAGAVRDGAVIVAGGSREGALHAPTVLDHVRPDSLLVSTETFGPVAPVVRVRNDEEAVAVANSTPYGLQAGVITQSYERFMAIAGRLEVGAVHLMEGPAFDSPHIPFGGVKESGIGREGVRWSIAEMTVVKTLTLPLASS
jgi:acyl-CoA reductase-like NAD-dependent aldehyde dehydrogenase